MPSYYTHKAGSVVLTINKAKMSKAKKTVPKKQKKKGKYDDDEEDEEEENL